MPEQPDANRARARPGEAIAITLILLATAALRLVRIASLPPGFFQDEAVYAVNAQTILDGAARIYFGEREPLYEYLAALGMAGLGRSPLATHATSALIAIVGVAAAGALANQLFGRRIGLLAAAGMGASLWLTTIGRLGFRAITLPTVECLGLALFWRATRTRRRRDYVLAGLVLGLTLYTYLAARFLPFALAAFVGVCSVLDRSWLRHQVEGIALALGSAIVACLPLGLYALRHPEMLYGRPEQVALPSGSAFLPAFEDAVVRTLGMIAIRGDANWRQNLSGAPVFDPLNALIFFAGVVIALRWRKPEAWFALVIGAVMLAPSMLSIDSPHYLRTLGAAGPIYALWALGLDRIARAAGSFGARWRSGPGFQARAALPTLSAAVIGLVVAVSFGRTAYDYFVVYARSPQLRAAFATDLVAVGQTLAASPIWRADRASVYLPLSYDDNRGSIAYFLYPLLSPAERPNWIDEPTIGTFVDFGRTVPLPVAPSIYVVPPDDRATIPLLGSTVTQTLPILDHGQLAAWEVLAEPKPPVDPSGAESTRFGSWLDLESSRVDAATSFAYLRWKVLAKPPYQPSVFVYVQDAQGHTIAQADQEIGYPLESWRVGQELITRHPLRLPAGTPPGTYHLVVGVYDKSTGQRETPTRAGRPVLDVGGGELTLAAAVPGLPDVPIRLDRPIAPGLTLVGFGLPNGDVEAGTKVPLTLVWQAADAARPDLEVGIIARAADGSVLGEEWAPPGGAYPTSAWAPAQAIREIQDVAIPAKAVGPVGLSLAVRTVGSDQSPTPVVELARVLVKASTHDFAPPTPRVRLDASFAGVGRLVGADLPTGPIAPGSTVKVTLYWRASGSAPAPYTVFVHLLDAQSHVLGQRDEPPVHGTRPTTSWVEGEYVADVHEVAVDRATKPGAYQIEVGMYDPVSGQRVSTGTPDNRIVVGSVRVAP